jgi:hypothetical protein
VSLQGGHHWEFVCDEDDPMVFGLVSALPGAKLDASLPSDGLIQVEARNGQRFFLSRSSLVALTISRVPAGQQTGISAAAVDLRATGLLMPMPFVMRENVFDRPTVDEFLQVVARRSGADDHSLQEVEIGEVPTEAVQALVGVLADARACLARDHGDETHISVGIRRLSGLSSARLPLPDGGQRLLEFVVWLTATSSRPGSIDLSLPDRWIGRGNAATPTTRTISMAPNTALVFPSANAVKAVDLQCAGADGSAIIISGSLCEGAGVESH